MKFCYAEAKGRLKRPIKIRNAGFVKGAEICFHWYGVSKRKSRPGGEGEGEVLTVQSDKQNFNISSFKRI
jgi:hypothetical protein